MKNLIDKLWQLCYDIGTKLFHTKNKYVQLRFNRLAPYKGTGRFIRYGFNLSDRASRALKDVAFYFHTHIKRMGNTYLVRGADGKIRMECDPEEPDIIDVEPTAPRSSGGIRWKFYGIVAALVMIPVLMLVVDVLHVSPEERAYAAALARQQAMKGGCERILEKQSRCWLDGDKAACAGIQDSNAWYLDQFGELPEFSCPNVNDPLVLGAR